MFLDPSPAPMGFQTWIPAVAGVVGSFFIVTVVSIGIACFIKRKKNNSTKRGKYLSLSGLLQDGGLTSHA